MTRTFGTTEFCSSGKITGMLEVRTLTDGGQQPLEVARPIAEYIGAAETSLDFAHYERSP